MGRNSKSLLELLEKQYREGCSEAEAFKLAVRALLEVVESGAKSIEVGIMRQGRPMEMADLAKIEEVVAQITAEKEAEGGGAAAALALAGEGPLASLRQRAAGSGQRAAGSGQQAAQRAASARARARARARSACARTHNEREGMAVHNAAENTHNLRALNHHGAATAAAAAFALCAASRDSYVRASAFTRSS